MYRIENRRAAVVRVQSMLRALSFLSDDVYTHVPKDGQYGSETAEAVRQFQGNHGLTVTGRVDYTTFVALRDAQKNEPGVCQCKYAPALPLSRGMQGEDVRILHALIKKFDRLHPNMLRAPDGAYYGRDTEGAVAALCRFFRLPEQCAVNDVLLDRLTAYLRDERCRGSTSF